MNRFDLRIRGKQHTFTGPSCWAELSPKQLTALMRLRAQVGEEPGMLFPVLTLLYGMKVRQLRWLFDESFLLRQGFSEENVQLTLQQGHALLETLGWIGRNEGLAAFPIRRFRRYDFHFGTPRIWLKRCLNRKRYRAPGEALENATFAEFMCADKAYKDKNWPLLAAVLYRPNMPVARGLDPRQVFEPQLADARATAFAELDPALLDAIAAGYEDTLRTLQRVFVNVFQTADENDAKAKVAGNWLDVAVGMAKLDVTKIREIEQTNLYLALKVLDRQIREADEMDEKIEQLKQR